MRPSPFGRLRAFVLLAALGAASVISPRSLAAQGRELHWPAITVQAHLDADGRLRVREEQQIRFAGAWNGAERRFDVKFQQKFSLRSLTRLDARTGQAVPMIKGDLDVVDGYDWSDEGNVLRWRSRLPDDPPFAGEVITYVLETEYENILEQDSAGYRLNHDFAFSDRNGPIDRFELSLSFDAAWRVPDGFPTTYAMDGMAPGRGYVVAVPLTYVAAGLPSAVFVGASRPLREGLVISLGAVILAMCAALVRRDRSLGRFASVTPHESVTPEFIEQHVLVHAPEVIGSMWDDHTSAPEVAATLARLVYEGKMTSRVERKKTLFVSRDVLHLRLSVPREKLNAHELALVSALFESHRAETSTEQVRERYKSSGFDPASVIKPLLEATALKKAPKVAKSEHPSPRLSVLLFFAAVLATLIALVRRAPDVAVIAPGFGAMLPVYLFGVVWAVSWRKRVAKFYVSALGFLIPLALIFGIAAAMLDSTALRGNAVAYIAVVLWALTFANSITMAARTHDTPQRIAIRKRLWVVRDFFARELREQQPQLRDAWFPYVIAFGLGREADRWFKAFGAATASSTMSPTAFSGSSGSTGSSGSGWSGFGGGGGFSGAGSGGSFAAAVGEMAAAVSAPSSSSGGGGGGGGGGGSGGGGGGGW